MFPAYNLKSIIPELYLYSNSNSNPNSTTVNKPSTPTQRPQLFTNISSPLNRGYNLNFNSFNPLNLLISDINPQNEPSKHKNKNTNTNTNTNINTNTNKNIDAKNIKFNDERENNLFNSRIKENHKLQYIIYKIKNIIKEKELNNINHLVHLVCYYFIHEFNDIEYGTLNELKALIKHYFSIKNIDEDHLINTILDIIKIKHQVDGKNECEYVYNVYLLQDIESKLVKKLSLEIYDWLLSLNNHSNSGYCSTSYPLNKSKQQPQTTQPPQPLQQSHHQHHKQYFQNYYPTQTQCQTQCQNQNSKENNITYQVPYEHIQIPTSNYKENIVQKEKNKDCCNNLEKKIDNFITNINERISLMEDNIDTIISQIKEILNYKNDKEFMQSQIDDINWILNEIIGSDLTTKIKNFRDCVDSNCKNYEDKNTKDIGINDTKLDNKNVNDNNNHNFNDNNVNNVNNVNDNNVNDNNVDDNNINLVIDDVHNIADSIVDEIIKSCK